MLYVLYVFFKVLTEDVEESARIPHMVASIDFNILHFVVLHGLRHQVEVFPRNLLLCIGSWGNRPHGSKLKKKNRDKDVGFILQPFLSIFFLFEDSRVYPI